MELQYYGANCIRITTKKASLVADDNLAQLGLKTITKAQDISIRSSSEIPNHESRFCADLPGEYEISEIVIEAVAVRAHNDDESSKTAVAFKVIADDIKVLLVGNIHPGITDEQIESIGLVDIMIVPVGGNSYTLEPEDALKLIKKIEPKIVIPTHYADKAISYDPDQKSLEEAVKGLSMEAPEAVVKFKPKTTDFSDTAKLVILERS